jgi:enamine deaminase RidA (YjgF/YER057c/UK114 family)
MGRIEARLKELGIELPASSFAAKAKSVPWKRSGNTVYLGGASPQWNGEFVHTKRLGDEADVEEGRKAARLTAINMLMRLKAACDGDLDRVTQCLMLQAYVRCTDSFNEGALVVNGASELLLDVFGEAGTHARTVVGVRSLSRDITVEISSIWEVAP